MISVFFTDRDLGKRFPETLLAAGIFVQAHHAHFEHDAPDEEWLAVVGDRGWYVLTHNKRIRYTPNEIATVKAHGVGLFVLVGNTPVANLARNFIATRHQIDRFIASTQRPFVARIYRPAMSLDTASTERPGRVEAWK